MNVSVALCTYNGEKYIQEQLKSIAAQTLLPSEIVICDDCSVDRTVSIIEKFAERSRIPVHLHQNEKQLGVMQNFRKAIMLCKGDFVALSDQDDVWLEDKLKKIIDFFSLPQNKDVQVVFSDLQLVDHELNSLGKTMWEQIDFNKKLQKKWKHGGALDILISQGNYVTGASLVLKTAFIDKIEKILLSPYRIWMHDGIIALVAAKTNSIAFINEVTGLYRQHEDQVIGGNISGDKPPFFLELTNMVKGETRVVTEIEYWVKGYSCSREDLVKLGFSDNQLDELDKMIRHYTARQNMPVNRLARIPMIIRELFSLRYYKYSKSLFLATVKDLFKKATIQH